MIFCICLSILIQTETNMVVNKWCLYLVGASHHLGLIEAIFLFHGKIQCYHYKQRHCVISERLQLLCVSWPLRVKDSRLRQGSKIHVRSYDANFSGTGSPGSLRVLVGLEPVPCYVYSAILCYMYICVLCYNVSSIVFIASWCVIKWNGNFANEKWPKVRLKYKKIDTTGRDLQPTLTHSYDITGHCDQGSA